jgi:enoyl-[acyl-carrier protein] reductase I
VSMNMRKGKPYTEIDYGFNQKTLDISATSLHRLLATTYKLDALNEWGSVVALTYIAAQRVFPDYSEMADAKALLESIARSFGYHYALKNKVRVNTVSQSPTRTTAWEMQQAKIVRIMLLRFSVILPNMLPCKTCFMMVDFLQ